MSISRDVTEPSRRAAWPWLVMAFVFLCLAFADPKLHLQKHTYRYLFAIDITQSMNVGDMSLRDASMTRLNFAKAAVGAALRTLPCGSEAGLAIFTAHRTFVMFTPVETCEHFRALSDMLEKVDWRIAWAARSEIAKGLYSALDASRLIGRQTRLVFLTDGHEAPPLNRDILPPFRADPGSVTGLIAGVGGSIPGRIPHFDEHGKISGYWSHDEVMQIDLHSLGRPATEEGEAMVGINMANIARRIALGREHLSSLREPHLQELALQTGLDYVRADSVQKLLEVLLAEKYARRTQVLSAVGWFPAMLALASLVYCFIVVPWRENMPRTNSARAPMLHPE